MSRTVLIIGATGTVSTALIDALQGTGVGLRARPGWSASCACPSSARRTTRRTAEEYAQAYASGWGDFTTDTLTGLLGRPPRDIADFARDHAAAFAPADDHGREERRESR
ncbi:hypothetical protein [Planomonospora algeriensis]